MPATNKSAAPDLDLLCINTIRTLAMDAVQKANAGHPGTPMALAPIAYLLYTRHLRHNPRHPEWPDRDRFVLSCGHASMLLYATLHLAGYDLSLDDLKQFRQWGSRTPGHPEHGVAPGVETTTGPLGPGVRQRGGDGHRRGPARGAVQPTRPPARGSPDLRDRQRRRPDGGDFPRGGVACRPPEAGEADLPVRRQPHHDRGLYRPGLQRGRGAAVRRLRVARPARGRRQRPRRARRGHRRRQGRRGAAVADHRPHAHRLGEPAQAGHGRGARLAARRGGDRADQGRLRMAGGRAVPRAGGGARALRPLRGARREAGGGVGGARGSAYERAVPGSRGAVARRARRRAAGRLGAARCRPSSRRTARRPRARGRRR